MADQQDQSSLGGSVEKASASADASKLRGKNISSGSSRKRQGTSTLVATLGEKRRKQQQQHHQQQTDPQPSQACAIPVHRRSIDLSKGESKAKGERKNHGSGVGSITGKYFIKYIY